MAKKIGGLNRGLEALFDDNSVDAEKPTELRLSQIVPNRDQPRKHFDDDALRELSESIKAHGLIQPLLVRPNDDRTYTIVAGERRWRASRLAGLDKVPVIIREITTLEMTELALIENLQREDLNPIEEAAGYKQLMETYGFTQEKVAERVGKSRPAVANALRLLSLLPEETEALKNGQITGGHARALLSLPVGEIRQEALRLAISGASVREIENLSKQQKPGITVKRPRIRNKFYVETEVAIAATMGRRVKINGNGRSGTIQLEFFDDEDLKKIACLLTENKE